MFHDEPYRITIYMKVLSTFDVNVVPPHRSENGSHLECWEVGYIGVRRSEFISYRP